jgi:hypothetical protein
VDSMCFAVAAAVVAAAVADYSGTSSAILSSTME